MNENSNVYDTCSFKLDYQNLYKLIHLENFFKDKLIIKIGLVASYKYVWFRKFIYPPWLVC